MNNLEDDLKNKGIKFQWINICVEGLGPAKGDFSWLPKNLCCVEGYTDNPKKLEL